MKIRSGFVSNSSSSSFCIIGVSGGNWISQLEKAEGKHYGAYEPEESEVPGCDCNEKRQKFCPECGAPKSKMVEVDSNKEPDYLSYGCDAGKVVTFYGSYEANYAGIDATGLLEGNTLKQAREYFVCLVEEKLGVKIPTHAVDLHFGEAGEG
jgi:hypothetical protein